MVAWQLLQLLKAEVFLVAKSRCLDCGNSLPLHNINSCLIQHTFIPPLEVVGPGGGLLMLLSPCPSGEMPAERSLAGGNGDGGIWLGLDDGSTSSSAGGRVAAAWRWRLLHRAGF